MFDSEKQIFFPKSFVHFWHGFTKTKMDENTQNNAMIRHSMNLDLVSGECLNSCVLSQTLWVSPIANLSSIYSLRILSNIFVKNEETPLSRLEMEPRRAVVYPTMHSYRYCSTGKDANNQICEEKNDFYRWGIFFLPCIFAFNFCVFLCFLIRFFVFFIRFLI